MRLNKTNTVIDRIYGTFFWSVYDVDLPIK